MKAFSYLLLCHLIFGLLETVVLYCTHFNIPMNYGILSFIFRCLTHFFACASDVRQWEYISYCLSQLTFTEKGMKKLIDNFKMFEHGLSEDSVMNHFRTVVSKVGSIALIGLTWFYKAW